MENQIENKAFRLYRIRRIILAAENMNSFSFFLFFFPKERFFKKGHC
jgi:hypothetical protein